MLNILSVEPVSGGRIKISGPALIRPDSCGLTMLRHARGDLAALHPNPAAEPFPISFRPYADADQTLSLGELSVENTERGLSVMGAQTISLDSPMLTTFARLLDQAIAAIAAGVALPSSAPAATVDTVANPFA